MYVGFACSSTKCMAGVWVGQTGAPEGLELEMDYGELLCGGW